MRTNQIPHFQYDATLGPGDGLNHSRFIAFIGDHISPRGRMQSPLGPITLAGFDVVE